MFWYWNKAPASTDVYFGVVWQSLESQVYFLGLDSRPQKPKLGAVQRPLNVDSRSRSGIIYLESRFLVF